jgi:Phage tail tube protein
MPTPVTAPTQRQVILVAPEVTQGTQVLTGMFAIPVDNFQAEPNVTALDNKALYGDMAEIHGRTQGPIHESFSLSGPMFPDAIGYLLKNILGDQTESGASAPFTHAFSLLNSGTGQPTSLTIVHQNLLAATTGQRYYPGCCLSELTLKGNADSEFVTVEAKGMSWPSSAVPTTAVTPTFTAVTPIPFWKFALGVGGTTVGAPNKKMRDWSLTITRALRVENTAQNSQNPFIIQRGAVGMAGSLTFTVPSDETELTYLLANTQPQVQLLGTQGASAALTSLQIDHLLTAWDTAKEKLDEEAIGFDVTYVAIANTTNAGASGGYSPGKITIQNAVALATY